MCVCVGVGSGGGVWGVCVCVCVESEVGSKTGSNLPRISKCIQESMGRGKER